MANAATADKTMSISTQSVQKSCISSTNGKALYQLNPSSSHNSLLENRFSQQVASKTKILEQIPTKTFFVSMEATESPKRAFACKVEKKPFAIEKQKFSHRSTRNFFVQPSNSFPLGLGDAIQAYDSYIKREERKVNKIETFIKDNKIVDPRRITLMKETSAKLREQNLSLSKRRDVVLNGLELTSQSCHKLASSTSFTEQHKDIFLQDSAIAGFLLETGFPPKNPWFTKIVKDNLPNFRGSTMSNSDPEIWHHFKYKAMGVLASDLAVELTQLRWHLGTEKPYFTPVVKVSSLTKDYFKMQVSQLDSIVREGWEEQISANRGQNIALTRTVIRVDYLRGESLFSYYDKMHKACFEDELFSVTGNKLSNIRDRRCLSEIIEVNQLNPHVLFSHGFRSDTRCHFEEWAKCDDIEL